MATFAPMPSASERMATIENPGLPASVRAAYRQSDIVQMLLLIIADLTAFAVHWLLRLAKRRLWFMSARGRGSDTIQDGHVANGPDRSADDDVVVRCDDRCAGEEIRDMEI